MKRVREGACSLSGTNQPVHPHNFVADDLTLVCKDEATHVSHNSLSPEPTVVQGRRVGDECACVGNDDHGYVSHPAPALQRPQGLLQGP